MTDTYLDAAAVAKMLGVQPTTVHQYRLRGTIPPPDLVVARSPAWREETIRAWLASRPGSGAGGGRRSKAL